MDIIDIERKSRKSQSVEENPNNNNTSSSNINSNINTSKYIMTKNNQVILPPNAWTILVQFAKHPSLSVNELDRIFRSSIHIHTISRHIKRLKNMALITLYLRKTGKTHRENRYRITMEGFHLYTIQSAL